MFIKRRLFEAGKRSLQLGLALGTWACAPSIDSKSEPDAEEEQPDNDASQELDAGMEPSTATDAAETDADSQPDAAETEDASVEPPAPPRAKEALCTGDYGTIMFEHTALIRGSWQFNPGGPYVEMMEPGYPCAAFLQDGDVRPSLDDPNWTDTEDGEFVHFSEVSTVPESGYTVAQFRYFRSLVFVPEGAGLRSLTVSALGIDDAIHIELFNSKYPDGISPIDAGPSDPEVGACQGNDAASWDFQGYVVEGEVNVVLVVHADMNPATSTLAEVRIEADAAPIPLVSCKDD
jgi:hypothetical protein